MLSGIMSNVNLISLCSLSDTNECHCCSVFGVVTGTPCTVRSLPQVPAVLGSLAVAPSPGTMVVTPLKLL